MVGSRSSLILHSVDVTRNEMTSSDIGKTSKVANNVRIFIMVTPIFKEGGWEFLQMLRTGGI